MFARLDYSIALEYSIIRRYTNIVYYYIIIINVYNSRRKIIFEKVKLKLVHFHTLSLSDK